jgi:MFS-type transporter involved in bile tolerance (Atg22 family)
MTETYHFDILNTKAKQIRLLANLILFLNAVAFIYFGIQTSNKSTLIIGAAAASIIVIGWVLKKA